MAITPCLLAAFLCFSMYRRALGFPARWIHSKACYLAPQLSAQTKSRCHERYRILARIQPYERRFCRTQSTSASTSLSSHSLEKVFCSTLYNDILPKLSSGGSPRVLCLLGVSGGCDSVALFHLMRQQRESQSNLQLHVVHFDHQQRGIQSNMDRELVEELCTSHDIPLSCYFWNSDRRADAAESSSFSQAAARSWRQSRMCELLASLIQRETMESNTLGVIFTAHHQDDSNETLWLKFLRGTHITHLQGMPSVTQIPSTSQIDARTQHSLSYIAARPLLHATKKQILDYLLSKGFTWREDESNRSSRYLRNRVRNELLPLVEDMVGGPAVLQQRLDRLAQQSREVGEYLTGCARDYLREHCIDDEGSTFVLPIGSAHLDLVHKQALVLWVTEQSMNECQPQYDDVERVCAQLAAHPNNLQWTINLGGNWDILRCGGVLKLHNKTEKLENKKLQVPKSIAWRWVDHVPEQESLPAFVRVSVAHEVLSGDPQFVLSSAQLNPKLPFTAPWRRGHRSVPVIEFLRGQGIPLHERYDAPVVLLKGTEEDIIVAVHVTSKNLWIRNAEFDISANEEVRGIIELNFE